MPVVSRLRWFRSAAVCTGSRQPFTGTGGVTGAQGYSVNDIIHILMAEGGQAERTFTGTGSPLHRATGRMAAVAETEKRRHQGNTLAEYPYRGRFSAV